MESELIKLASSQGVWAALSVALIFYILKAQEKRDLKQEEREKNYQNIIEELTEKFTLIEEVRKDVKDIKEQITPKNQNDKV
ncbi:bacteriocin UviB precursor [Clostridium homopropionicum DSM 5847]|uniref:Bacteriocin UviB n=1 Tax=Clostridium homopropionicum DSM 5847 TaxID=1121318 RepID=A0A0L6ZEK8_9CLOT|nr:BhlA/UviB family holin-like peptide [Clostridium homopropionicum]KOA21208.1 bacteriocin UviB precursor [Clostridium homopropionicum DSM 5847]SFG27332.1 BhlA holin family protein [Clostridium homopropionicum]